LVGAGYDCQVTFPARRLMRGSLLSHWFGEACLLARPHFAGFLGSKSTANSSARYRRESPVQPCRYFFGMVAKWPRLPFVDYDPILVDDVESLGPAGIQLIRSIVHAVNRKRELIVESSGKILGDSHSVFQ